MKVSASWMRFRILLLLLALPLGALAQEAATITFTFDFPGSVPGHYSVTVRGNGKAEYTSGEVKSEGSDADGPFRYEFTMSEAARQRVFELAERARYFEGEFNYTRHAIASSGNKTLTYKDSKRNNQATYNYTTNQPVQQLTTLFQSISATLEFGERLQYKHKYQKLALDEELKRMEEAAKDNGLTELQAVAPILKQILADSGVMNVTRARAERLLAQASGNSR
jgi:hypothetical protein